MVLIINILTRRGEQVVTQWDGIEEMSRLDKCAWDPQEGASTA